MNDRDSQKFLMTREKSSLLGLLPILVIDCQNCWGKIRHRLYKYVHYYTTFFAIVMHVIQSLYLNKRFILHPPYNEFYIGICVWYTATTND